MNPVDKLVHESAQTPDAIADFLNALTRGFEKRHLTIHSDVETVTLIPSELIEIAIKASRKKGKFKLSLKFSWRESTMEQIRHRKFIKLES